MSPRTILTFAASAVALSAVPVACGERGSRSAAQALPTPPASPASPASPAPLVPAALGPAEIAREEGRLQAAYDQLEREYAESLALRLAMIRLAATGADLKAAGLSQDLLGSPLRKEESQADDYPLREDGSLPFHVYPLYYQKLPIRFEVARETGGGGTFTVQVDWTDASAKVSRHPMKLRLDPVARTAVVTAGAAAPERLKATDFRIVFPTRPQVFVTWPAPGRCEILLWNGYARLRVALSADGIVPAPVIGDAPDLPPDLPPHLRDVSGLTTLLPTTDGRLVLFVGRPLTATDQLPAYDRGALAALSGPSGWATNPFGASDALQTQILRGLCGLEAVDDAFARADRTDPASLSDLQTRRVRAVRQLTDWLDRLNDATANANRRKDVLRQQAEALRHERLSQLQLLWLRETGALSDPPHRPPEPAAR